MEHDLPLERLSDTSGATAQSLLAAVVDNAEDAIIVSDLGGLITSWNLAATRMFGIAADEALGRPLDNVIPNEPVIGPVPVRHRTVRSLHDQFGSATGNCSIIRDIDERRMVEHECASTHTPPSLSHQAIVHDLRGPVAMAGSLVRQAMDMPDDSIPSREDVLALAARCVDQTTQLLDDVGLLFHAYDRVDLRTLDLVQVIDEVADGIPGLDVGCVDVPHAAFGCRTTLVRMVRNILENARRHAMRPDCLAHVLVSASRTPTHWSIHFDDDGPGIRVEELDRMFEPYYRGSSPASPEGTGLGLAIVHAGAVAHGGDAHAENRSAGGLRVTVRIAR